MFSLEDGGRGTGQPQEETEEEWREYVDAENKRNKVETLKEKEKKMTWVKLCQEVNIVQESMEI